MQGFAAGPVYRSTAVFSDREQRSFQVNALLQSAPPCFVLTFTGYVAEFAVGVEGVIEKERGGENFAV